MSAESSDLLLYLKIKCLFKNKGLKSAFKSFQRAEYSLKFSLYFSGSCIPINPKLSYYCQLAIPKLMSGLETSVKKYPNYEMDQITK